VKKASQFRKANAWPVPDEPAFMMIGPRATMGLCLARMPSKLEELSVEVEISSFRPGPLDDIDPLLRECVGAS